MKKIIFIIFIIFITFIPFAVPAFALVCNVNNPGECPAGSLCVPNSPGSDVGTCLPGTAAGIKNLAVPFSLQTAESLAIFIANFWDIAFLLSGLTVLLYLVVSGFQFLTSGGEKTSNEAAKGRITNALIGLALIALSYAIIKFIGSILNIEILKPIFPTPK